MKPIIKTILWSTLVCLIVGYVVVSAIFSSRAAQQTYDSIVVDITDRDERLYLTEDEILGLIGQERDVQRIEQMVRAHPMVRTAECYRTTDEVLHVRLEQRIPLLRVITATESYFLDTDRHRMPVRERIQDQVLLVEGHVGERMVATEMAEFAEWLQGNRYWQERIDRVYVRDVKHVDIIQRAGEPKIILGPMAGYQEKLERVRIFYVEGLEKMASRPTYTELDVQYRGQVVGR